MLLNKFIAKGKQKFYKKMFISYSIITLFAVVFSTSLSMMNVSKILTKSTEEINKNLLYQVKATSDNYIFHNVNNCFSTYFNIFNSSYIFPNFFNTNERLSPNENHAIYRELINISIENDYMFSIFIYNQESKTVISSYSGLTYEEESDKSSINSDFIFLNLKQKLNIDARTGIISPKDNYSAFSNNYIVTFYQVLDTPVGKSLVGINVDTRKIIDVTNIDQQQIAVINNLGEVIAHSDNKKFGTNYFSLYGINKEFSVQRFDEEEVGLTKISSQFHNFSYILISPLGNLYSSLDSLRLMTIFITLAVLIIILSIIYFVTTKLYSPINEVFEKVKELSLEPSKENDEFAIIDDAFSSMNTKILTMQDTFLENKNLILNALTEDIIYGKISDISEIEQRFGLVSIDIVLNKQSYLIMCIELNSQYYKEQETQNQEFVIYDIISKLKAYYGDSIFLSIRKSSFVITALIISNGVEIQPIDKFLNEYNDFNINIAISDFYSDILTTNHHYETIYKYLKYSFACGYNNIFNNEFINTYENSNYEISTDFIKNIESNLRATNTTLALENIENLVEIIKTTPIPYRTIQSITLQIITVISRISKEYGVYHDELLKNNIMAKFENIKNIDDFLSFITYIVDIFKRSSIERTTGINAQFMDKIASYINLNIEKNLSLENVAQVFSISPSYLSKMFKEKLNINFSNYLIETKFEASKDLLKNTDLPISEISYKIGYSNTSYFIRLFKERYSLTPLQFRKINANKSNQE